MHHPNLVPFGFGDRWLAPLAEHPDCKPARVVRHDGDAGWTLIGDPTEGALVAFARKAPQDPSTKRDLAICLERLGMAASAAGDTRAARSAALARSSVASPVRRPMPARSSASDVRSSADADNLKSADRTLPPPVR